MRPTILFADNERGIRLFCRQELEAEGFRVVLAEDGDEAVNLVSTYTIDLAILDEHMPRCGGRESASRMKVSNAELPVILFTADSFFESYSSPQVDATVIKSSDLTDLRAVIAKLLPATRTNQNRERTESKPASSAVAINSAFFQEIKEENINLSFLLTSLRAWLRLGPSAYHQRDRFVGLLRELQEEVNLHFSLEEGYGYFENAVSVAPDLAERAGALRDEHKKMESEISRLVEQAESVRTGSHTSEFGNLLARARSFLDQLQSHETCERELISLAFNNDLGTVD